MIQKFDWWFKKRFIETYDDYNENNWIDEYLNYYHIPYEYNSFLSIMKESYYPIEGKMVGNNIKKF